VPALRRRKKRNVQICKPENPSEILVHPPKIPNQRNPESSPILLPENGFAEPEQQRIREPPAKTLERIEYTPVQKPTQPTNLILDRALLEENLSDCSWKERNKPDNAVTGFLSLLLFLVLEQRVADFRISTISLVARQQEEMQQVEI
jgi:hypothetical protein